MEYKNIIKEYKEYTKGYAERSEMLLKAFGGVPEPTDEERQEVYDAIKHELTGRSQEEINLCCAIEYATSKYEEMLRNGEIGS